MTKKIKHSLTLILSTCILAAANAVLYTTPVSAQTNAKTYESSLSARTDSQTVYANDWNTDDLFAGYVEQAFHSGGTAASLRNMNAANKLTGQNRILYHALKSEIAKVANGVHSSTEFSIPVSSLLSKTTYSADELGLSGSSSKEDISNAIEYKIFDFSLHTVMSALLTDCPYELYWHSKYESTVQYGPEYILDAAYGISFPEDAEIVFQLPVDSAYAAGRYKTDTAKTGAATTAAANAKSIVAAASGKSDYEKLAYYRQQICELTSYDDAAAAGTASDSNPWQMIYVFDKNPSTNVVCEGYAKAFQYLCDETVFSNANIYCYTITGTMHSRQSSDSHMWNIVHMGSSGNYLVDVTNSDTGSIGDRVFLTGYTSGNVQSGYTIQIPAETYTEGNYIYTKPEVSVRYQYSNDMYSLYTAEELTLAQDGILSPELVLDNEAHTHTYKASFSWSTDHESCSASIICQTNPAHAISDLRCNISSQVQVPATCTAAGTTAYTARISYEGAEYSDTLLQKLRIDPDNHSGGTNIQNAKAATATQNGYTGDTYCSGCGALIKIGTIIPAANPSGSSPQTPDKPDNTPGSPSQTPGSPSQIPDNTSDNTQDNTSGTPDNTQEDNKTDSSSNHTPGNPSDEPSGDTSDNPSSISNGDSNGTILDTIKVKKASVTIKKGKSIYFQLRSSLDMKKVKKITYKSTKKSVAKVSKKGKITGKKSGTAIIKATVTLKNGMKKTVTMKIKVKKR